MRRRDVMRGDKRASDKKENGRGTPPRKRLYRSPQLNEWGSIQDLTRGVLNPPVDFPAAGGSSVT